MNTEKIISDYNFWEKIAKFATYSSAMAIVIIFVLLSSNNALEKAVIELVMSFFKAV